MRMRQVLITVATVTCCSTVNATDIAWSGFVSAVAGTTLDEGTTYNTGYSGFNEGIYDDEIKFQPETLVGLQAQIPVTEKLRGTVQLISRDGVNADVELEWGYIGYAVNDELTINAGRFRFPTNYYSDFLDVGKAYYWIRPPAEVYAAPSRLNGINVYYRKYIGSYEITSQYWYGSNSNDFGGGVIGDTFGVQGLNFNVGEDWWTVRAVYARGKIRAIINDPNFGEIVTDTNTYGVRGLAFVADYNNFLWRSEYFELRAAKDQDYKYLAYASIGYRIGAFTPHFTYTDVEQNPFIPAQYESSVSTVGVAWDFNPSAVLKVEYLEREPEDDTIEDVRLISIGLDFVF